MKLKFTKMHGAGNDFVVLDATQAPLSLTTAHYQKIADRRFGVGADQILVVEPARAEDVDFSYRIFNADGGEVEQCGNGARAFVRFVHEKGLTNKRAIRVQTMCALIEPRLEDDGLVTVDMGAPVLEPERVPFNSAGLTGLQQADDLLWTLEIAQQSIAFSVVSMGNPHAVQVVASVDDAPVTTAGPLIENHPRFPRRVNAGFMQVLGRHEIRLRVWERGAGETLACGTGACAAVVAGIRRGLLDSPVTVHARGGDLRIHWSGTGQPVLMTGPAVTVFEGEMELAD